VFDQCGMRFRGFCLMLGGVKMLTNNSKGLLMGRWLIEEEELNYLARSSVGTSKVLGFRKLANGVLVCSLFLASLTSFYANAIGVGSAEADSFIGEPLSVRIPLFNVDDPSSLSISFESQQFGGVGQAKVDAILDRSNSQLTIRLSSDSVVNEPYINFKLDLVDSNSEFTKEFTVLMDLRSGGPELSTSIEQPRSILEEIDADIVQRNNSVNIDLMGPYDIAQAGRIPARFGAVLDGQSLWRVARRINEAMGVTRSQMMWSLYKANPDAFSSRSVSSLLAGSFLTIPDELTVKSVSDVQAKAELAKLRLGDPQPNDQAVSVASNGARQEFDLEQNAESSGNQEASSEGAAESPFQVTGIDSAGKSVGGNEDAQSQQIIASLTETVGNLSQQLFRKDQKIEFLEQQVSELKSFIGNDATNIEESIEPAAVLEGAPSLAVTSSSDTATQELVDETVVETSPVELAPPSDAGGTVLANEYSSSQAIPIWQWLLLGFFALSVLAYFLRSRLSSLFQSLNLFGSNDQVEFGSVATDTSVREIPEEPKLAAYPDAQRSTQGKDYSLLNAVEKSMEDPTVLGGISYLDLADDGSYEENEILDFETKEMSEDLEDLSFDERFERLLAEKDFDFARELLDFARHNEINDERYHCERLRLLEKMKDEDGFYEYYYEIESKIPTFPQNLQTQISQLVVQLAHH